MSQYTAGCLLVLTRWRHLKTIQTQAHLTSIRNKPQQQQHGELSALILAQTVMLVNMYNYRVMVKVSLAATCVWELGSVKSSHIIIGFLSYNGL